MVEHKASLRDWSIHLPSQECITCQALRQMGRNPSWHSAAHELCNEMKASEHQLFLDKMWRSLTCMRKVFSLSSQAFRLTSQGREIFQWHQNLHEELEGQAKQFLERYTLEELRLIVRFYAFSLLAATSLRNPWEPRALGIENSLHYVRDVTFAEDRSRIRDFPRSSASGCLSQPRHSPHSPLRIFSHCRFASLLLFSSSRCS